MAFVFADSVKETSTTTGTGTLNLAGAVSGFRTFVAGIGTGNTCPYTIEDANGTAWEHGIGTVTDATPDTLARTTILSSSTGSAINLSAGTHTVYCAWPAERAQQVNLEHVAGTDAATTMTVGQMYVVDMSAWATADRTYTLPATALVGDRVGITVSAGNASYELIIKPNTGDTINGGAAAAEWSRLFITGEVVILRCITADSAWVVERDGRVCSMGVLSRQSGTTNLTDTTWVKIPCEAADVNVGNIAQTGNTRIQVRRAGNYVISGFIWASAIDDTKALVAAGYKNGAALRRFGQGTQSVLTNGALGVGGEFMAALAVDDYIELYAWCNDASPAVTSNSSADLYCHINVAEII